MISWCHTGYDLKRLRWHDCYHLRDTQTFLWMVGAEAMIIILVTVITELCHTKRFFKHIRVDCMLLWNMTEFPTTKVDVSTLLPKDFHTECVFFWLPLGILSGSQWPEYKQQQQQKEGEKVVGLLYFTRSLSILTAFRLFSVSQWNIRNSVMAFLLMHAQRSLEKYLPYFRHHIGLLPSAVVYMGQTLPLSLPLSLSPTLSLSHSLCLSPTLSLSLNEFMAMCKTGLRSMWCFLPALIMHWSVPCSISYI